MLSSYPCPVCDASNWKTLRAYAYSKKDVLSESLGDYRNYINLRRRVLFEVWFPGSESVTLHSILCRDCGFIGYTPRPSEQDLAAKYRFLQTTEKDIGGEQNHSPEALLADQRRAWRVFQAMKHHAPKKTMTILDFGGGNGKLLRPFMENGHRSYVVDYNLQPLPGVERLGATIDDLQPRQKFDAIICSHVLEHVSQPARLIQTLSEHLEEEGIIYGEVPAEIWKGVGQIGLDPVTHVNYFNLASFCELFSRQGLPILSFRHCLGSYAAILKDVLVLVAGKKGRKPVRLSPSNGVGESERFLNPSLSMRIQRHLRHTFGKYRIQGVARPFLPFEK